MAKFNTPKSATGGNAQVVNVAPGSFVLTDLRASIELKPPVKARLFKTFWPYASTELLVAMMDGLRGFQLLVQHRMINALRDSSSTTASTVRSLRRSARCSSVKTNTNSIKRYDRRN